MQRSLLTTRNKMEERMNIFLFQKGNLIIRRNYRGITFTDIVGNVYNASLVSNLDLRRDSKEKIRTAFEKIAHQLYSFEGIGAKNCEVALLLVDLSQAFDSIYRGNMEQKNITAIIILYIAQR